MKLWVDDIRPAPIGWYWAKNFEQAVKLFQSYKITHASLDHDLAPEHYVENAETKEKTGYDLINWMERFKIWPSESCVVHSLNPVGARRMAEVIARHYECRVDQILKPFNFEESRKIF